MSDKPATPQSVTENFVKSEYGIDVRRGEEWMRKMEEITDTLKGVETAMTSIFEMGTKQESDRIKLQREAELKRAAEEAKMKAKERAGEKTAFVASLAEKNVLAALVDELARKTWKGFGELIQKREEKKAELKADATKESVAEPIERKQQAQDRAAAQTQVDASKAAKEAFDDVKKLTTVEEKRLALEEERYQADKDRAEAQADAAKLAETEAQAKEARDQTLMAKLLESLDKFAAWGMSFKERSKAAEESDDKKTGMVERALTDALLSPAGAKAGLVGAVAVAGFEIGKWISEKYIVPWLDKRWEKEEKKQKEAAVIASAVAIPEKVVAHKQYAEGEISKEQESSAAQTATIKRQIVEDLLVAGLIPKESVQEYYKMPIDQLMAMYKESLSKPEYKGALERLQLHYGKASIGLTGGEEQVVSDDPRVRRYMQIAKYLEEIKTRLFSKEEEARRISEGYVTPEELRKKESQTFEAIKEKLDVAKKEGVKGAQMEMLLDEYKKAKERDNAAMNLYIKYQNDGISNLDRLVVSQQEFNSELMKIQKDNANFSNLIKQELEKISTNTASSASKPAAIVVAPTTRKDGPNVKAKQVGSQ